MNLKTTGRGWFVVASWFAVALAIGLIIGIMSGTEHRTVNQTTLIEALAFVVSGAVIWMLSRNKLTPIRRPESSFRYESRSEDVFVGHDIEWWAIVTTASGLAFAAFPGAWFWTTFVVMFCTEIAYSRLVRTQNDERQTRAARRGTSAPKTISAIRTGRMPFLKGRGIAVPVIILLGVFLYGFASAIVAHSAGMHVGTSDSGRAHLGGVGLILAGILVFACSRNKIRFEQAAGGAKVSSLHRDVFVWTDMEWWALSSALVGISYYAFFQAAELMNQISFPLIAVIAGLIGGTMMAQENEKAK